LEERGFLGGQKRREMMKIRQRIPANMIKDI